MSELRTFATFDAELPDDSEFSESGDILVPGGRGVCLLIMQLLQEIGLDVSQPEQHQFYGWELNGELNGSKFWFLLQYPESWLLIVEDKTGLIARLKTERMSLQELLDDLGKKLTADHRIHGIQWFTKKEYESGVTLGNKFP
ncbi:hypothetical protein [Sphingomonas sp. DT-204]|uniref:hypothetical protein n=1 Tax=Sphingomonas sp. DT-204 TaxID=3396166 RepID=UPI003F1DB585